jgi:hypothetical protein
MIVCFDPNASFSTENLKELVILLKQHVKLHIKPINIQSFNEIKDFESSLFLTEHPFIQSRKRMRQDSHISSLSELTFFENNETRRKSLTIRRKK